MRAFLLASTVVAAASTPPPNKWMMFKEFKVKFGRNYDTEFEEGQRFQIFSENVDKIYASNAKNLSYTLGITAAADWTSEEFRSQYLGGFKPVLTAERKNRKVFSAPKDFTEPDSVDWVAKGGVTSIKNQGTCGSCWTFSTVGALEGAMFVAGRTMVDLSMQHILSCDDGGNGCKGGDMDQAFDWVKDNGVPSLTDEPYLCQDQTSSQCQNMQCPADMTLVLEEGDVTDHTDVDQSESALEAAVAQQPVSVAIEADKSVFQLYTGGVLTNDACGETLDHGVLAVGYGVDNGQKYWKVKNSWGTTFGENGYIRIEKGDPADGGECGIRKRASFPTIKTSDKQSHDVVV